MVGAAASLLQSLLIDLSPPPERQPCLLGPLSATIPPPFEGKTLSTIPMRLNPGQQHRCRISVTDPARAGRSGFW